MIFPEATISCNGYFPLTVMRVLFHTACANRRTFSMNWITNNIDDVSDTTVTSRTTFDDPRDAPPSVTIAMALASLEDTPPSRTNFALIDEVDPDALDDLVTDDTHDVRVTFTVDDYVIVAQSNGTVKIHSVEE